MKEPRLLFIVSSEFTMRLHPWQLLITINASETSCVTGWSWPFSSVFGRPLIPHPLFWFYDCFENPGFLRLLPFKDYMSVVWLLFLHDIRRTRARYLYLTVLTPGVCSLLYVGELCLRVHQVMLTRCWLWFHLFVFSL